RQRRGRSEDRVPASGPRLVFGFQPFSIEAASMRAAGRQLHSADQRKAGTLFLGQAVFGEQVDVADPGDAAEILDAVDDDATAMRVRAFAKVIAADVG